MKKASRSKNSAINILTGFFGSFLTIALRFVTRTVFVRTLGASFLGINGLFADIITMLSLTELGFDTAINYKLYKPLADGDIPRIQAIIKFYKTAYRIIGIIIAILGCCLIPLLPHLIKDYSSLPQLGINAVAVFLLYLAQSVSTYMFFAYASAIVNADQKTYLLNFISYFITIAQSLTQIVILVVVRDFMLYTATGIIFNVIGNVLNAAIAKKHYPYIFEKTDNRLSKNEILDLLKDIGAIFLFKVNVVVLKATDNIVLSSFAGLTIVGLYSNYLLIYNSTKTILYKLYSSVKASTGNLFVTSNTEKKYEFFKTMNFLTIIIYGTAAVMIAILADELISTWIGQNYAISKPLSFLIGIELIFSGLKENLGQIRNVSGVFKQAWYRPIIGVVINIVVSIVLVQVWGIYGVIIGTITSDICSNFLFDPLLIHKYTFNNYKPVRLYYGKNIFYLVILFLIAIIDFYICNFISLSGWAGVIIHSIVCFASVPIVFFTIFHKSSECKYLLGVGKRLVKRQ